jgi:hypothetical protein
MSSRGLRNNNPGNIRHSSTEWDGMSEEQTDSEFVQFDSPVMGIRAMTRILRTYRLRYNLKTVSEIIMRWAPPNENDTPAYIDFVADQIRVGADDLLTFEDYYGLVKAIIKFENGEQPYDNAVVREGVELGI